MITQQYLKDILFYDPETGLFKWIQAKFGRTLNKWITTQDKQGYVVIKIDGVQYLAHRLAWLYMTGEWPSELIDHKDTIKNNNKWLNLREANYQQNMQNRNVSYISTTNLKGVFENSSGNFIARIQHNGEKINLGTYKTKEEAHEVYKLKASQIQGEFARNV